MNFLCLNKTFDNLPETTFLQVFWSQGRFAKKFKKKFRKFNPRKYKIATFYCEKNYQNVLSRIGFITVLRLSP